VHIYLGYGGAALSWWSINDWEAWFNRWTLQQWVQDLVDWASNSGPYQ
jgi:hypothetical protein